MMLQQAKLLTQEVLLFHLLQSAINNLQPSCWGLFWWITMHKTSRLAWRKQSAVPVPHCSTTRLLLLATMITETQLVLNTKKMETGKLKRIPFPCKRQSKTECWYKIWAVPWKYMLIVRVSMQDSYVIKQGCCFAWLMLKILTKRNTCAHVQL